MFLLHKKIASCELCEVSSSPPPPRGGGFYSHKNWAGVCGPLPKTLTLFMTKTCEILYPIYDLTLKSKPSSDQTVNINVKGFC